MTKQTIELDMRRGMAAQKATELRRLMSEVSANEELLRSRQKELEEQLLATPATTWADAADKARKATAYASLWFAIALLIGAFTASLMATFGGRLRDQHN